MVTNLLVIKLLLTSLFLIGIFGTFAAIYLSFYLIIKYLVYE